MVKGNGDYFGKIGLLALTESETLLPEGRTEELPLSTLQCIERNAFAFRKNIDRKTPKPQKAHLSESC